MPIYYADSSALLKRYRNESGSTRVMDILEDSERTFISRLTAVEVSAALTRRARTTQLSLAELRTALSLLDADLAGSFEIIELDRPVMTQAVAVARKHGLRGADAIQLASTLFVQREILATEIMLLSSDDELNAAAVAEGLRVENPNVAK
jgi:hypothetical protein